MSEATPKIKGKAAEFIATLREHLPELRERYGVETLGIFGSYVREEEQEGSDLDLLVEINRAMGLFEFMALEDCLSELLGVKVDLVMKRALRRRIGERILEEVVQV